MDFLVYGELLNLRNGAQLVSSHFPSGNLATPEK